MNEVKDHKMKRGELQKPFSTPLSSPVTGQTPLFLANTHGHPRFTEDSEASAQVINRVTCLEDEINTLRIN